MELPQGAAAYERARLAERADPGRAKQNIPRLCLSVSLSTGGSAARAASPGASQHGAAWWGRRAATWCVVCCNATAVGCGRLQQRFRVLGEICNLPMFVV